MICISTLLVLYGLQKAQNPTWKEYTITTSKPLNKPIEIILLTDLHLKTGTNEETINTIVNQINQKEPDVVILGGDIYDENTPNELKEYAYQQFGKMKTIYGTYYIEGNHDLITKESRKKWEQNHITVLTDQYIEINQEWYLVGRKDKENHRQNLTELMKGIDSNKPIIVVNHRPDDIKSIKKMNIDLQLSGHTHAGQLFPGNLFMKYGYYPTDHLIVSSGYGNWGIPIRTSIRNEIVRITVVSDSNQ